MRSLNSYKQLLRLIDRQTPSQPTPDNVMQLPSTIFTSVLQMYNCFKKQNQSKILQNKVYTVPLSQTQSQMASQSCQDNCHPVTISLLCAVHKLELCDIDSLLISKQYLVHRLRIQVLMQIVKHLNSMNHLSDVLKGYSKVVKSEQCIKDTDCIYTQQIEQMMMEKILSLVRCPSSFPQITAFIYSLPHWNQHTLILISDLFEFAVNLTDFKPLYVLYVKIFDKLSDQGGHIAKIKRQTIAKITIEEHIKKIVKQLNNKHRDQQYIEIIEHQVRRKMSSNFTFLTDKTQKVIDFIFQVLSVQSGLWLDFIIWHGKLPEVCRHYAEGKMETLARSTLGKNHEIGKVIGCLVTNEQEFEISQHFVRLLLFSEQRRLLIQKSMRRFVAVKILVDKSHVYWDALLQAGTQFTDIILEMFSFKQSIPFFNVIIGNPAEYKKLETFLNSLKNKKPMKLRELFISIDKNHLGEVFGLCDSAMIRYLKQNIDLEISLSMIREMANYIPSVFCIEILHLFLNKYHDREQKLIRLQIIRTLNTILVTRNADQLNNFFKKHLKQLIVSSFKDEAKAIFEEVPKETNDALKQFYHQSAQ